MKKKMSKMVMTTAVLTLSVSLLAGCGSSSTSSTTTSASAKPASSNSSKPYIPVISKGFQHQFWQAVKQGAEKAAKEYDVNITFEGPETEAQVDKQIEMLQAALDKKPTAIAFAALDSKASVSLLQKAKSANIPVIGFDSGVDSDIPVTTAATDNKKPLRSPLTKWPRRLATPVKLRWLCMIKRAAPVLIAEMAS